MVDSPTIRSWLPLRNEVSGLALNCGIVVDSTCDMPADFYRKNGIEMVPLRVIFSNGETYLDNLELDPGEFFVRLMNEEAPPKTSQPPSIEFKEAYEKLLKKHDFVISLHLPEQLSGTIQSARMAVGELQTDKVFIFDTGTVSAGIAHILEYVLEAREKLDEKDEFLSHVDRLIKSQRLFGMLDTLKYLELGGRIGRAQALIGSLLDFKPLLTIEDGIVTPLGRARGKKKAYKELLGYIKEFSGGRENFSLKFGYCEDDSLVNEFKDFLDQAGISYRDLGHVQIGQVIGTYVGPSVLIISMITS